MIASLRLFYPIRKRLRIGPRAWVRSHLATTPARWPPNEFRAARLLDGNIPSGYDGPIGRNTDNQ
jgi:hypothetical protein